MIKGKIAEKSYKPKFSGHETFPFRYLWISKILISIEELGSEKINSMSIMEQMVEWGVGANMTKSIKHWSIALGIITHKYELTQFGELLLKNDKYLEDPQTLWLLHWKIASNSDFTTWFYVFNYLQASKIEKSDLTEQLITLWPKASRNTIERDVDCFIRMYTYGLNKKGVMSEDSLECPLAELHLISPSAQKGSFEIQRGIKYSLTLDVFKYALAEFCNTKDSSTGLISFDALLYSESSPAKIFCLPELVLSKYLEDLENDSTFKFIDGVGGLKQIQSNNSVKSSELLKSIYKNKKGRRYAA
tara:strand:- start:3051 stop:3959 length:909 start_codon:yes stop_codon:yes gene_type:complete